MTKVQAGRAPPSSAPGTTVAVVPVPSLPKEAAMLALRRILVPHDFTEPASAAFDHARVLAGIFDASCEVLHVTERAGTDLGGEPPAGVTVIYRHGVPH